MSRQDKTRRRLFVLLGAVLAVSALAGGAALYRLHHIKQIALEARADGLASMARGDYATALPQFGTYLSRYPTDVDILLPYAKARRLVEEPNSRHLGQAIGLFQRVLELKPGLREAQDNLLELYFQIGYNTEAISTADAILALSPDDTKTLRIKILVLMRMQRLDQAETNAQHLTAIAPLDLELHILEMQIMLNRGKQNAIEGYADRLAKAHPADVRFELLKSVAASLAGDPKSAIALVQPLVKRPQVDAGYTLVLVRQLDRLELFADTFDVLEQAAKSNPEPQIQQLWIRRLFETGRLQMLVEQTAKLDPSAANVDVEVIGMRILALTRLERRSEAMEALAAMEKRGHAESSAGRWAEAIRAVTQASALDPIQTIALLRNALISSPGAPILLQELGDAYAAAGASDKAASYWREAARLAPAWSAPLVRLAQTLGSGGRSANALAMAKAAQRRAPEDRDALMSLVVASAGELHPGPSAEATEVLAQIAKIKQKFPKESGLLTLQASVLAQSGQRDAAVAIIREALVTTPALAEPVFLSLARLSETFKLEQEEACFDASQKSYGLTADLAFARAHWLLNHQRGHEGLTLLEKAYVGHADDITWRNVWASYLDIMDDPRGKSEWIALGDGNPNNAKIQWAALAARSVQSDHDFTGRTIDRLVALIGEDSMALRLVRARWLLQGNASEKDVTQASILSSDLTRNAPEMVAPRLLLATCYMKMGNTSAAIDQLAAVSDMQPEQAGIALELARLLQARGDFTRARQFIDRGIKSNLATVQNNRQAASLLAQLGDYPGALALLEKTYAGGNEQPPDLMLAALYRQLNQPKKTDAICQRLLEKPDASIIAFCADFYASQDRTAEAQHVLTLLDSLKLPPGAKEFMLATFAARHGTVDEALSQFQAAAKAAPKEVMVWQQLITFCLGTGKIDEALAAAEEAARNLPAPANYDSLRKNSTLVKDAAHISGTSQLLMMLADTNSGDAPVLDALHIIVAAEQQKVPARQTAAKLRLLADRNPRVLPLQTITLQYYMGANQIDEAVNMATRSVQSFPAAVEPLRLATGVLSKAQQWDLALGTAKEWRRLGSGENLDADMAIASAELNMGNATGASQQIQPYLERALHDPDKFRGVILLRALGLLVSHQPAEAETLIGPLLAKSAQWRTVYMSLATVVDDANRAEAWMNKVVPFIPENSDEKAVLAQSWIDLGRRWKDPKFELQARKILEPIVRAPAPPLNCLVLWGSLCEASEDWSGAEHAYRQALQFDSKSVIALNNLAFVLVKNKGDLGEAQRLVAMALELNPNVAAFLDTRATIQSAQKDYTGAIASMKEAQRIDPNNISWHINLLQVLLDAGQTTAARAEAQQIDLSLSATPNVAPKLRQRFETLKARLPP